MPDVYHTAGLVAVVMATACGAKSETPPPAVDPGGATEPGSPEAGAGFESGRCEPLAFSERIDIAEASAADFIDAGLMIASDSGNNGAYVVADPETGAIRERGELPLGDAGDDFEGLARHGDGVVALTSGGWVHHYRRAGAGFELEREPYAIGPKAWRCAKGGINCGPNWEGLCLGAVSVGARRCDGLVVSKRDGALFCVRWVGAARDRLTLVSAATIDVVPGLTLSGCAIAGERIWAVTNVLGGNAVLEIDASGGANPRVSLAPGSTEAVAVRDGVVYRLSDTGDRPSVAGRYRCP